MLSNSFISKTFINDYGSGVGEFKFLVIEKITGNIFLIGRVLFYGSVASSEFHCLLPVMSCAKTLSTTGLSVECRERKG